MPQLVTDLKITHLNHKGYGVATQDGKTYWVMNALPAEVVNARILKKKKGVLYCHADIILSASPDRLPPLESAFTATSPWQIMTPAYELLQKEELIRRSYLAADSFTLPRFAITTDDRRTGYRNKVEFSFYYDDLGQVSLAFHKRDTRNGKVPVTETSLLPPPANEAAQRLVGLLNQRALPPRSLKGLTVRYSFTELQVTLQLFVMEESFTLTANTWQALIDLPYVKGLALIYSDPRSPAFVMTKELHTEGDLTLTEEVNGLRFQYPGHGFFQVNPPLFASTLRDMQQQLTALPGHENFSILDLYAGVGTIGLSLASRVTTVHGVELTPEAQQYARHNAAANSISNYTFSEMPAEKYWLANPDTEYDLVVLDPPRAGVHPALLKQIMQKKPEHIFYLSCNPVTQARDLALLSASYLIGFFRGYNFYPQTPHVESLAVLSLAS